MTVTNSTSGTNVHEVAEGIYRINTPVQFEGGGGFSFNQYLVVDDDPLLFTPACVSCFRWCAAVAKRTLPLRTASLHCILARGGRRVRFAQ